MRGLNELLSRKEMLQLLWLVHEKETGNAFLPSPPHPLHVEKKSLKYLS